MLKLGDLIIFLLGASLALSIAANVGVYHWNQQDDLEDEMFVDAILRSTKLQNTIDTLTDVDTILFAPTFRDYIGRETWHVIADSLSGSTDAKIYFYESPQDTGSVWFLRDSLIIDGVQTVDWSTYDLEGMRTRAEIISAGTQSTRIELYYLYKRT
jgi:hypothetical protein